MIKQVLQRVWSPERRKAFLASISLDTYRKQQVAAIALAVLMVLSILGSVGWTLAKSLLQEKEDSRSYIYIPFDEYDAAKSCEGELKSRIGNELLRSYVDKHSTRFDSAKGVYRVYMNADVGTLREYREVAVYCFVDKWDFQVSYFKQLDADKKTIMSSELQFFSN